jgi:Caspase domain
MRHRLLTAVLLFALQIVPAAAEKKLALVIGINDYREIPKLEKAVGDAQAIGQTLSGLGYEVTTALDMDRRGLNLALSKLYASVEPGDTVLVHYSGHGVQIENDNYLLPADVPAPTDGNAELLKSESLRLLTLIDTLGQKGAGARILIIDACRDNPFATGGKRSIGGTRGLANVATDKGTFIMYSAGAGQAALDRLGESDTTSTSVYTRVLLSRLKDPSIKLRDLAASVRDEVEKMGKSVGHDQRPAYYDDLPADFSLAPGQAGVTPKTEPVVTTTPVVEPPKQTTNDEARLAWEAVKDLTTLAPFDMVASRYPNTLYGDLASARAAELRAAQKQVERPKVKPAPPPVEEAEVAVVEPPKQKPKPAPSRSANLRWGVILGSFQKSEASAARSRLKAARNNGFDAVLIDTTNYSKLSPNLFAVVIGAPSRDGALSMAEEAQVVFGDAYAKQLQ